MRGNQKLTDVGFTVKDASKNGSERKSDGSHLGHNQIAFDFDMLRGGRFLKVEAKMARLSYGGHGRGWWVVFRRVDSNKHDVLLLVLEGLEGLTIFEADSVSGFTDIGTEDGTEDVIFTGPVREKLLPKAIDAVLGQMRKTTKEIGFVGYEDDGYSDIFGMSSETMKVYREYGMPLLLLSAAARGLICEWLARIVLEALGETTRDSDVDHRV